MRIAVDTAILIRANSRATGPARELLQAIQDFGAQLILPCVLAEVERVLRSPRIQQLYHVNNGDIWAYLRNLESMVGNVRPSHAAVGVEQHHPATFAAATVVLAWIGLLAGWLPARRA